MKVIETEYLDESKLNSYDREFVYNGLDACVTAELIEKLLLELDDTTAKTYAFSLALQGPVLEMRLRGVKVDPHRRAEVTELYLEKMDHIERNLVRLVGEAFDLWEFNWRSPKDLQELFYERLQVPIRRRRGKPTVDRDALEHFGSYIVAQPIVLLLIGLRELSKKIGVLQTDIDPDGRIRTSYNIAGTNTGRFSSSLSEFGTGTNLQNVEDILRSIFISDKGMKMGYFDAEQIQSRIVGALEWNEVNDGKYLDACETGDLHTTVSKLCEPGWPWVGDLKSDREIAERSYYRHHSLRKLCKSIGHGTNFLGQPDTLHMMYKVERKAIEIFQGKYFAAFPGLSEWHEWTRKQLYTVGWLISITGRKRCFFGRRDNEDVLREALAFSPQADEAGIVNSGMLNVWSLKDCQLLLQNHDAIVVQFPEEKEDEIVPKILKQLRYQVELKRGRALEIPYGCKTGWNFGEYNEGNLDGLKTYRPGDKRRRQAEPSILDRKVSTFYRKPRAG